MQRTEGPAPAMQSRTRPSLPPISLLSLAIWYIYTVNSPGQSTKARPRGARPGAGAGRGPTRASPAAIYHPRTAAAPPLASPPPRKATPLRFLGRVASQCCLAVWGERRLYTGDSTGRSSRDSARRRISSRFFSMVMQMASSGRSCTSVVKGCSISTEMAST